MPFFSFRVKFWPMWFCNFYIFYTTAELTGLKNIRKFNKRHLKNIAEKSTICTFPTFSLSQKEFLSNTHSILRLRMLSKWKINSLTQNPEF